MMDLTPMKVIRIVFAAVLFALASFTPCAAQTLRGDAAYQELLKLSDPANIVTVDGRRYVRVPRAGQDLPGGYTGGFQRKTVRLPSGQIVEVIDPEQVSITKATGPGAPTAAAPTAAAPPANRNERLQRIAAALKKVGVTDGPHLSGGDEVIARIGTATPGGTFIEVIIYVGDEAAVRKAWEISVRFPTEQFTKERGGRSDPVSVGQSWTGLINDGNESTIMWGWSGGVSVPPGSQESDIYCYALISGYAGKRDAIVFVYGRKYDTQNWTQLGIRGKPTFSETYARQVNRDRSRQLAVGFKPVVESWLKRVAQLVDDVDAGRDVVATASQATTPQPQPAPPPPPPPPPPQLAEVECTEEFYSIHPDLLSKAFDKTVEDIQDEAGKAALKLWLKGSGEPGALARIASPAFKTILENISKVQKAIETIEAIAAADLKKLGQLLVETGSEQLLAAGGVPFAGQIVATAQIVKLSYDELKDQQCLLNVDMAYYTFLDDKKMMSGSVPDAKYFVDHYIRGEGQVPVGSASRNTHRKYLQCYLDQEINSKVPRDQQIKVYQETPWPLSLLPSSPFTQIPGAELAAAYPERVQTAARIMLNDFANRRKLDEEQKKLAALVNSADFRAARAAVAALGSYPLFAEALCREFVRLVKDSKPGTTAPTGQLQQGGNVVRKLGVTGEGASGIPPDIRRQLGLPAPGPR